MGSEIETALDLWRRRLGSGTVDWRPSIPVLRTLGLSNRDLVVHLERWRVMNDSGGAIRYDRLFEEHALEALDLLVAEELDPVPEPLLEAEVLAWRHGVLVAVAYPADVVLDVGDKLGVWPGGYGPPTDRPVISPRFRGLLHEAMGECCKVHEVTGGCPACQRRVDVVMDMVVEESVPGPFDGMSAEDVEYVCAALMEVGGWEEIDGDGTDASIIAEHIRRLPRVFEDLRIIREHKERQGARPTRSS